jgi:hypothetical protein
MKTKKNKNIQKKINNLNKTNKIIKNKDFLKPNLIPKTKWQKRLKSIADRDLALIPISIDKNFKMKKADGLLIISNNQISLFAEKVKNHPGLAQIGTERIEFVKSLLKGIIKKGHNLPDLIVPFNIGDSYMYDYNGPYFCWSKPINKNGLLFPHWNFKDWNSTVRKFKDASLPWNERKQGPFFRGNDTTRKKSNIRKVLSKHFSSIILTPPFNKPPTEMCEYKYIFDIAGGKPWSIRSPFAELSQAHIIRPLQFYSKWDEKPWVQFYDVNEPTGFKLDTNYDKPLTNETLIKEFVDYTNKFQNKRSLYKSDLLDLTEDDIHFYILYLFHHLQKYNKYFYNLIPK